MLATIHQMDSGAVDVAVTQSPVSLGGLNRLKSSSVQVFAFPPPINIIYISLSLGYDLLHLSVGFIQHSLKVGTFAPLSIPGFKKNP